MIKTINDSDTINENILELDNLLIEGYKAHRDFFADCLERANEPDFDITAYYARELLTNNMTIITNCSAVN